MRPRCPSPRWPRASSDAPDRSRPRPGHDHQQGHPRPRTRPPPEAGRCPRTGSADSLGRCGSVPPGKEPGPLDHPRWEGRRGPEKRRGEHPRRRHRNHGAHRATGLRSGLSPRTCLRKDCRVIMRPWVARRADRSGCDPAGHQPDHGPLDHGFGVLREPLVVMVEPPAAADPGQGPLHHPASRQHLEPDLAFLLAHDRDQHLQHAAGIGREPAGIPAVSPHRATRGRWTAATPTPGRHRHAPAHWPQSP